MDKEEYATFSKKLNYFYSVFVGRYSLKLQRVVESANIN